LNPTSGIPQQFPLRRYRCTFISAWSYQLIASSAYHPLLVSFLHNFPTSLAFHCFRASDTSLSLLHLIVVPIAAKTEELFIIMASASAGDTADLSEQRPRKRAKYTQVAWSAILVVALQVMQLLMISVMNASGGSSNAAVEQRVHAVRVIMHHVFIISFPSQRHPLRQSKALQKTGRKWFRYLLQSVPNVGDLANSVSASHLESLLVFARTNSPIRNPIR
jgi:hypothetical protein